MPSKAVPKKSYQNIFWQNLINSCERVIIFMLIIEKTCDVMCRDAPALAGLVAGRPFTNSYL